MCARESESVGAGVGVSGDVGVIGWVGEHF